MKLELKRIKDSGDATFGILSIENKFVCFTLEDQHQNEKVASETRIPAGKYQVAKKFNGRFLETYSGRWGHQFVPWLTNVPGFTDILIHTGNKDDHTSGCILVGLNCYTEGNPTIGASWVAYQRLYDILAEAYEKHEKVYITIKDEK